MSRHQLPIEDQRLMASRYEKGDNASEIAKFMGYSPSQVYKTLERHGVSRRSISKAKRKYTLNEHCFSQAENNPGAAYWAGFLMADGCVGIRGTGQHSVKLALSECDRNHVEKFRRFLETDIPVRIHDNNRGYANSKPLSELFLTSITMVKDLSKYGVVPRKSKNARVSILNHNIHFWRGMIDGDGFLAINSQGIPVVGLTGNQELMSQFVEFLSKIVGISSMKLQPNHNIWKVDVSGRKAVKLINHLCYDKYISLERKRLKSVEIMKWVPKKPDRSLWTLEFLNSIFERKGSWIEVAEELGVKPAAIRTLIFRRRKV